MGLSVPSEEAPRTQNMRIKTSSAAEGLAPGQDTCLEGVQAAASQLMASPPSSTRRSDFSTSEDELENRQLRRAEHASGLHMEELIGRGAFGSVYRAMWRGMRVAVKVIEHDDEELSLSADVSPLSSCAALHAFAECSAGGQAAWSAARPCASREEDACGGCLGSPMSPALARLTQVRLSAAAAEGAARRMVTSSMATTRGSQALLEAAVSSTLVHPNIVQTFDYQVVDLSASPCHYRANCSRETHIVMEYCNGGSLEEALAHGVFHRRRGGQAAAQPGQQQQQQQQEQEQHGMEEPDLEAICATLRDVAAALEYLHLMRIMLKDLKPKNVLLTSCQADRRGFVAKVSDFGLSQLQPEKSPCAGGASGGGAHASEAAGTVTHMAPEMLCGGPGSCASDVYSFAILAWELWTGEDPYPGLSKVQIMFGVVSQDMRPQVPRGMPAWLASMVASCWARDPKARPTFAELRSTLARELTLLQAAA